MTNTLKYRRTIGDMIEVYKIQNDDNVNLHLERQKTSVTRGHSLKLVHPRCHYDLRKYSFCKLMEKSARECRFSQHCKYL